MVKPLETLWYNQYLGHSNHWRYKWDNGSKPSLSLDLDAKLNRLESIQEIVIILAISRNDITNQSLIWQFTGMNSPKTHRICSRKKKGVNGLVKIKSTANHYVFSPTSTKSGNAPAQHGNVESEWLLLWALLEWQWHPQEPAIWIVYQPIECGPS